MGQNLILIFGTKDKFNSIQELNKYVSLTEGKQSLMQKSNIDFNIVYITEHKLNILKKIKSENSQAKVVFAKPEHIEMLK